MRKMKARDTYGPPYRQVERVIDLVLLCVPQCLTFSFGPG